MTQKDRAINWQQQTSVEILRRINAADGSPGVLDKINGRSVYLYKAHKADQLSGRPGDIIATSNYAVCRATIDGALWLGHMKAHGKKTIKLPATVVLQDVLPKSVKTSISIIRNLGGNCLVRKSGMNRKVTSPTFIRIFIMVECVPNNANSC